MSQHLSVDRLDAPEQAPQQVDAQLQLDASGLLLAGFAFGQRVLLLRWDGEQLQEQRHPRLPVEVDSTRMLRDIGLVFWSLSAIQAALPAPWQVMGDDRQRVLSLHGQPQLTIHYQGDLAGSSRIELVNLAEGYRLLIESQAQP